MKVRRAGSFLVVYALVAVSPDMTVSRYTRRGPELYGHIEAPPPIVKVVPQRKELRRWLKARK